MKNKLPLFIIIAVLCLVSCSKDNKDIDDNLTQSLVVTTGEPTEITETSAKIPTEVNGKNLIARGVCYSLSPNPAIDGSKTTDDVRTGISSSTIPNLLKGNKYYVRSYATDTKGTVYGEEKSFTTKGEPETGIKISTVPVKEITATSAISGGNITTDGGFPLIQRGICWSLNEDPTTDDPHTTEGADTGIYSSKITGIYGDKTYYVRSYAINSNGTTYGQQISFNTSKDIPSLLTTDVSDVTYTTAISGGTIINIGDDKIITCGVCWSVTKNPTIGNSKTVDNPIDNHFKSSITNLSPNKIYYVRSYATNSSGTAYGQETCFNTPPKPSISTNEVSEITANNAICGGNVYDCEEKDILDCGLCWSTTPYPTINNDKISTSSKGGKFSQKLPNLNPTDENGTRYFVRSYLTTNLETVYGEQRSFKTMSFIYFTSDAFLAYCIKNYDKNNDGFISEFEIENVTTLEISSKEEIKDHTDLYNFQSLKRLIVIGSEITQINLTVFPTLEYVDISNNKNFQILGTFNCWNLKYLKCDNNDLVDLDLNGLRNLTYLDCSENPRFAGSNIIPQIELFSLDSKRTVDLGYCPNLEYFDCHGCNIYDYLDPSKCNNLQTLNTLNNPNLLGIYLNPGQVIKNLSKDDSTIIIGGR